MADRDLIQIYGGMEETIPNLAQRQLGYTTDSEKLIIGGLSGNVDVLKRLIEKRTIEFYVDPTGSDTNDGLTDSTPVKTIQKAFDLIDGLRHLGGVVTFKVNLASGNYYETNATLSTPTKERVIIQGVDVGGSPNVPTAIVNGGNDITDYAHGIRISGVGVRAWVKDVKFVNFTSNNTRIGLVGENESDLFTDNVHADTCDWCGIYGFNTVRLRVSGGILNNCRSGAIANDTQATFGYNAETLLVTNCTESGIYFSRGSQGHIDYTDFEDNAIGALVAENARANIVSCNFKRNTTAVRTQTGGLFGDSSNVYFEGTADANTTKYEFKMTSGETNEMRFSEQYQRVAYDRGTHTVSGDTPTTVSTPYTIDAYRMQGVGKSVKVKVYGIATSVTNGSLINITVGGVSAAFGFIGAQAGVIFEVELELLEVPGGYRGFGKMVHGTSLVRTGSFTGFDFTVDSPVEVEVDNAGAGDTCVVYRTEVYLMG